MFNALCPYLGNCDDERFRYCGCLQQTVLHDEDGYPYIDDYCVVERYAYQNSIRPLGDYLAEALRLQDTPSWIPLIGDNGLYPTLDFGMPGDSSPLTSREVPF